MIDRAMWMCVVAVSLVGCGKPEAPVSPAPSGEPSAPAAAISGKPSAPDATAANTPAAPPATEAEAVRAMKPDFRACYEAEKKKDPSIKGKVNVMARIGPSGEVVSASPTGTSDLPQPVVDCVVQRVLKGRFPPPAESGTGIVIPIVFTK